MAKNRALYEEALRRRAVFNGNQQWKEAFNAFRVAIGEFRQEPEPYVGLGEAWFGLPAGGTVRRPATTPKY